jgi:hypothetical protein
MIWLSDSRCVSWPLTSVFLALFASNVFLTAKDIVHRSLFSESYCLIKLALLAGYQKFQQKNILLSWNISSNLTSIILNYLGFKSIFQWTYYMSIPNINVWHIELYAWRLIIHLIHSEKKDYQTIRLVTSSIINKVLQSWVIFYIYVLKFYIRWMVKYRDQKLRCDRYLWTIKL